MRRFVDLHTHSIVSDGTASPGEVIRLADEAKLAAVALTDHDTTAGLAEASAAAHSYPELKFVPGIEISARWPGRVVHILGLAIDEASAQLQQIAEQLRQSRDRRNPQMIEKLRALGVDITLGDVEDVAASRSGKTGGIVGRLHMAEALVRAGHVKNISEAFGRYLADDGPAFVNKDELEPAEAISAIHHAGGVAVLAHPALLRCDNSAQVAHVITSLCGMGLDGIEAYHAEHSDQQTRMYLDLARAKGLGVTGGSDFHGSAKPQVRIGKPRVPIAAFDEAWLARILG